MNSALDKLMSAIESERNGGVGILSFVFRCSGYEFNYMGRFYAYVYEGSFCNLKTENEYGWRDYEDMLKSVIQETGRTVADMLAELPDHDLEIEFDMPGITCVRISED